MSKPSRRPRFSIFQLLFLLTVAGSVAAIFALRSQHRRDLAAAAEEKQAVEMRLAESRDETRRLHDTINDLRNQLGMIEVEDPTKIYATRLRTDSYHVWKWQVWLPEGRRWRLSVKAGEVMDVGFGGGPGVFSVVEPGEHTITLTAGIGPATGGSYGVVKFDGSPVTLSGAFDWLKWLPTERRTMVSGSSYEPQVHAPGPVELMRFRATKGEEKLTDSLPLPGFLVWIDSEEGGYE